jgi:hypothetical protein
MKALTLIVFSALAFAPKCCGSVETSTCGARVTFEASRAWAWYQATVIFPTDGLSADSATAFAECVGLARTFNFVRMEFFDQNPANVARVTVVPQSYGSWAGKREQYKAERYTYAQLHCVAGNCVLRFADGEGRVEVRVLRGDNPLRFDVPGGQLEILDVWMRPNREGASDGFARTTAPLSELAASRIYLEVTKRLGFVVQSFYLRNDIWFIRNGFPQYYPFAPQEGTPAKEEVEGAVTIECTMNGGAPNCRRWWGN